MPGIGIKFQRGVKTGNEMRNFLGNFKVIRCWSKPVTAANSQGVHLLPAHQFRYIIDLAVLIALHDP